jgi:hypothetical protein
MNRQRQQKQRTLACTLGLIVLLLSGSVVAGGSIIGFVHTVGDGKAAIDPDQYFGAHREMVTDMLVKDQLMVQDALNPNVPVPKGDRRW